MPNVTQTLAILAVAGLAATAAATDRHWVSLLAGDWDNPGNWALTDNGAPAGGLPRTGDDVFIDNPFTCRYTGAGIANPSFGRLELGAPGINQVLFRHVAGELITDSVWISENTQSSEYELTGGGLTTGDIYVADGFPAVGTLTTAGAGRLVASRVFVGYDDGFGFLDIGGQSFDVDRLLISVAPLGGVPGLGSVTVSGGDVRATRIAVGQDEDGSLTQTGGSISVTTYDVGLAPPPTSAASSTHDGGVLDVEGTLTVGAGSDGDGNLYVDGGTVRAGELVIAEGPVAEGVVWHDSGSVLVTGPLTVGLRGDAGYRQEGGLLRAPTMTIGAASAESCAAFFFGGDAEIDDLLTLGAAPDVTSVLTVAGGNVNAGRLHIGGGTDASGIVTLNSGSLVATEIRVGTAPGAGGSITVNGGSLSAASASVSRDPLASSINVFGGVARIDDLDVAGVVRVENGLLNTETLDTSTEGLLFFGPNADVRADTLVAMGPCEIESSTVSGDIDPGTGVPQIGLFESHGQIDFLAPGADLAMNVLNEAGRFLILGDNAVTVRGSLVNNEDGFNSFSNIDGQGGFASLEVLGPAGLTNNGLIRLDESSVRVAAGPMVNNGILYGRGLVESGVQNNGSLSTDGSRGVMTIENGLTFGPDGNLNIQIRETDLSSVRVRTGAASLDGSLTVTIAGFDPAPGTEFVVLRVDSGVISGTFDEALFFGSTLFGVEYRPDEVLVVVRCNAADVASPYGLLDLGDVNAFVDAFTAGGPLADLDESGLIDLADINLFVAAFSGGCP